MQLCASTIIFMQISDFTKFNGAKKSVCFYYEEHIKAALSVT